MTTILSTLFVLGILVFVHELGHFLVAKKSGIRVERFSLGFPPKMIGKKIGETEYMISWIPLGGYVKLAGENPDEISGQPWEFVSKPVLTRALVILAGPAMNFFLAILFFWGIFFFAGQQKVQDGQTIIGIVSGGSPAQLAGIKENDQILSINGIPVKNFKEMSELIHKQPEKKITVKWKRGGQIFEKEILTKKDKVLDETGKSKEIGKIGIGPVATRIKLNIFQALIAGISVTFTFCLEILKFLHGLITGTLSIKLIGGPIFIAQIAGETARQGILSLFSFTALLSVNLALLNLLPIPALDGGHLLFLLIEKLRGKPLSLKQRSIIQQIGMAFLLLLIILVTYNDIFRLIGNK